MLENTCSLNYEAEYNRLLDEMGKAKCEIAYWKERCEDAEKKEKFYHGALRAVEVIFGRKFEDG